MNMRIPATLILAMSIPGMALAQGLKITPVPKASTGAGAENTPEEVFRYKVLDALAKLGAQMTEQQKQIKDLHDNIALLQIQSGGIAKQDKDDMALMHIQIAAIDKSQTALQNSIKNIPTSSPGPTDLSGVYTRLDKMDAYAKDNGKRLLMTCVLAAQIHSRTGAGDTGAGATACTSAGWPASNWRNFDIPFGP